MTLDVEETIIIGQDTFLQSVFRTNPFGVTFEDGQTTGYFYAVSLGPDLHVLDGLHVYNVFDVNFKDKPRKIQIAWSDDGLIASLLINNYCHAIFDFENKAGYCRNGFPETNNDWAKIENRTLTDDLITEIFSTRK